VSLLDTSTLSNPLIRGFHHFFEIGIGQKLGWDSHADAAYLDQSGLTVKSWTGMIGARSIQNELQYFMGATILRDYGALRHCSKVRRDLQSGHIATGLTYVHRSDLTFLNCWILFSHSAGKHLLKDLGVHRSHKLAPVFELAHGQNIFAIAAHSSSR
ncbi:MAG: hypothetical protein QG625_3942, partial [Cyanobacteriota bacterium erpe_2018_sw_39hr_WHONDRS-SW48-000098_B_bin.30]|jgi:hypothetical protein|nr:hypothetical protein [Cyanobacteriota bacterium erpe_2018_sw_39hr_WHONDRS-SW48-000098_B_bin.30]